MQNLAQNNKVDSKNIAKVANVEVTLCAKLGKAKLKLKDAIEYDVDSIITLDRTANDPIDIFVNDILIAKGKIVAIEDSYGIKIVEIVEKMSEYAYYEYSHTIPAKDNVIEVLKILKKDNISLNVLTASPHITLDVCLKRLGVFDLFDNVWSCEDFNTTKADPMIYKMAAEKIGVPVEEILFFDDNYNADKTAKQAGMMVFGVYDDSSKEYVNEIK